MVTLCMSALILLLPIALSVYLWYSGIIARCCLLLICITGAVEANSVINPDMGIKEKYEQLLKPVNGKEFDVDDNTGWHCAKQCCHNISTITI